MNELTDEEFEKLKQYRDKKILIELSLARKFLTNINDIFAIVWQFSFTLFFILIIPISIYSLNIFGVVYSIAFWILLSSYIGICSIKHSFSKILFYISILGILISLILKWKIFILLFFTFSSFISVYLFYKYVEYKIINEIAFSSKKNFMILINNGILIV